MQMKTMHAVLDSHYTNRNSRLQLVQYGCGLSAPEGWRNFDASPTLRIQRLPIVGSWLSRGRVRFPDAVAFGDVTRGLPVMSDSVDAVYCSHVLEHLSLTDFHKALRETFRILRPGGLFRGVLPDLERYIEDYRRDQSPGAAKAFMTASLLGEERRPGGISALASALFGNHQHRWMWDYKALAGELEAAGFAEVRRATFGDEHRPIFADIEDRARWEGCLGFQCCKPSD